MVPLTLEVLAGHGHIRQCQLARVSGAILSYRHRYQVSARLQQALIDRHRIALC